MQTQEYNVTPGTGIRKAVEEAQTIARAVNKAVIVAMNGARFCIHPDTTVQKAIDTYLEVKNKMFLTQQLLEKQKVK